MVRIPLVRKVGHAPRRAFARRAFAFSALLVLLWGSSVEARPRINEDAKNLAKQLAPAPPAKKPQKELGGLAPKMVSILEILEKSYRSNGPPPESLITKALEFRNDIGRWESMVLTNTLLTNWREANALGLFGESGQFEPFVEKGRGVGGKVAFEHIVPAEAYPPASNQLANVRLVRVDELRKEDAPLTARESAYRDQFAKMVEERQEQAARRADAKKDPSLPNLGPTNALGQTRADQERIWNDEVERLGMEVVSQMPKVRVVGRVTATPSHMSQHRWRVRFVIENTSSHPTEVKAQTWLIGQTWKKRDHYIMMESAHPMKLRAGESRVLEVYTRSEGSYKGKADDYDELSKPERARSKVRYRGFAIAVEHDKGIAAFAGNDRLTEGYVNPALEPSPLRSMPRF